MSCKLTKVICVVLVFTICTMMCSCKNAKHLNESVDVTLNEYTTESNSLISEDSNDNVDIDKNSDIEDDIGWMFPKVDKELFTESEKSSIEDKALATCESIWPLYKGVIIDKEALSFTSGITNFSYDMRINAYKALGKTGVVAVTEDEDMINGSSIERFYNEYKDGKESTVTIYEVEKDGLISTKSFIYRDGGLQIYYVGVKPIDGKSVISGRSLKDIVSMKFTDRGGFLYMDKIPVEHAAIGYYYRIKPLSRECRNLTKKYLKYLDFQKYNLMVTDWKKDNVEKILMPGMFEDFYYIKYGEIYRGRSDSVPANEFEEIMLTFLPVTITQLRNAYSYDKQNKTYSQGPADPIPYPPYLEVTDYTYNSNGTITLYTDAVWPDYNSDCAFTNVIEIKPFDDGTFRILSNEVEEKELKLPRVAYSK